MDRCARAQALRVRKRRATAIQRLGARHRSSTSVDERRTIVYKDAAGRSGRHFYPDLQTPACKPRSRWCTSASRPTPSPWEARAPLPLVAHNGEINTLRGNVNWMRARRQIEVAGVRRRPQKLWPIIRRPVRHGLFDNALELLVWAATRSPTRDDDDPRGLGPGTADGRAPPRFYEYHAAPDGAVGRPAAMAFTDGRQIGATLDRNGLRPARYIVTDDDRSSVMASESGVLPSPENRSSRSGACSRARCSSST